MATFLPTGGVDETEPTLIADNRLQDTDGAEYRVGQGGVYVARGRDQAGDVGAVTGKAVYEAGYDSHPGFLIAHEGNSIHYARIQSSLTFTLLDNLPSGTSALVGSHYGNRHYTATGKSNRVLERSGSGVTSIPIGLSRSTFTIGVSVTQGAGSMSATTGLEYWATEYDSSRGKESLFGSTANTGAFTSLDSVVVTLTGTSANTLARGGQADQIRWYRSTDGGGFPDGGLIRTTAIGTTQITDTDILTATLSVPQYGVVSIGGLDTNRDEAPPALSVIFGPFEDSLMGVASDSPRTLRFTPAGYPDSWPSAYGIPMDTSRQDEIVTGVVASNRIGVFCKDSVHVIYRLPRDSDSIFAAGEAQDIITLERGCVSRRGACTFTPIGSGAYAVWVARDGIWGSNLASNPFPLTDAVDWDSRVDVTNLHLCRLVNDPINRRLVFIHRKASDTTHNTGLWYLDYQMFRDIGIRITFADHGPLADAVTVEHTDGKRRLYSIDSRASNGQVYVESIQDVDDSQLRDSDGSVRFRVRTKEFMPGGPRALTHIGHISWMHDAGPSKITHRFYHDRNDSNPDVKVLPKPTVRNADAVVASKSVNSCSFEIESSGTKSYGVHWYDIDGVESGRLGGVEGA